MHSWHMTISLQDKIHGMFLGIAIGDALGMPVETFTRKQIVDKYGSITNYFRPDQHKWFDGEEAGTTTDDTQLSLAVAEALLSMKDSYEDEPDLMSNLMQHMKIKHVEALDKKAGWGRGTTEAVKLLAEGKCWNQTAQGEESAVEGPGTGNGVAMKIAPLAAWNFLTGFNIRKYNLVKTFTRMTHASNAAFLTGLLQFNAISLALNEQPIYLKKQIDAQNLENIKTKFKKIWLETAINSDNICDNAFFERLIYACARNADFPEKIEKLEGQGKARFTSHFSYPLSMACFLQMPVSSASVIIAVNAGGDTDTNASMVGAIVGALVGKKAFAKYLIDDLKNKEQIEDIAERFCQRFVKD